MEVNNTSTLLNDLYPEWASVFSGWADIVFGQRDQEGVKSITEKISGIKVFGREQEVKGITMEIIGGHGSLSVIPITGRAGLDKTELVRLVFDDEMVKADFHCRIWVDLLNTVFDLRFVLKNMIESLTEESYPESNDLDNLLTITRKHLFGKKILLVLQNFLDNDVENWHSIISNLGRDHEGIVIIVTTENINFATKIATTKPVQISPLSSNNSQCRPEEGSPSSDLAKDSYPHQEVESIKAQISGRLGNLSVIPITGRAGLGKTTLARVVFNDETVEVDIPIRIWIDLPYNGFDLSFVFKNIIESITKEPCPESSDLGTLSSITHANIRGKKTLLVLDNFLDKDVEMLNFIVPALGRNNGGTVVIIVTTDNMNFATKIATTKPVELSPLSSKDSWLLFNEIVLRPREASLSSDLETTGLNIVQQCSGLPFAIREVALMLRFKREQKQWQHISNALKTGVIAFPVMDFGFYEDLPPYLKSCFQHCALFPEDHTFNKEHLTDLWAAEGFVPPSNDRALQPGHGGYYTDLLDDCFYRVQKSQYWMMSLWHNFAMRISEDSSLRINCRQTNIPPECQCLSLGADSTISAFPSRLLSEARNLKTLILLREAEMVVQGQKCQIREIPSALCQTLSSLCVLDLQFSQINQLPDTIVKLSNLRYLNLSKTDIQMVPESVGSLLSLQMLILSNCDKLFKLHKAICKLTKLEKLNLEGCHLLTELPEGMSTMKGLKYLNIHECSYLIKMPSQMRKLTNLETLTTYIASTGNGYTISELQNLKNLRGKLCLQNLEKAKKEHAIAAKLGEKPNIDSLTLLWRGEADQVEDYNVIEGLRPNQNLKHLNIISYPGDEYPSWIMNKEPYLNNLVKIKLVNLKNVSRLPPLGQLLGLKSIKISGLDSVTQLDARFFGDDGVFHSLEELTFCYMPKLEEWPALDAQCRFSCLNELRFICCPKLKAVNMVLPTVKRLTMWMNNSLLYGGVGSLTGLRDSVECVSFGFCRELSEASQLKGLQGLRVLKELEFSGCEQLQSLPQGLRALNNLKRLTILSCSQFVSLPDWLEHLSSLSQLEVSDCPMFQSCSNFYEARLKAQFFSYIQELKLEFFSQVRNSLEASYHFNSNCFYLFYLFLLAFSFVVIVSYVF